MSIARYNSLLMLVLGAYFAEAQGNPMVFAVNEGVTYRVNPGRDRRTFPGDF